MRKLSEKESEELDPRLNSQFRASIMETSSAYAKNAEHIISRRGAGVDVEAIMELVTNNTQQKNWKGILLALLVILVISALITIASILTTPNNEVKDFGKPLPMEFRSIHQKIKSDPEFIPNGFILRDPEDFTTKIFRFDSNQTEPVFKDPQSMSSRGNFKFSPNMDSVLVHYIHSSVFRRSYIAQYFIKEYNNLTREVGPPFKVGQDSESNNHEPVLLDLVILSSKKGKLAFCKDGRIYYYLDIFKKKNKPIHASEGLPEKETKYGTTDWLYEEEIFQSNKAAWWSKDATSLAFAGFDTSNVTKHSLTEFRTDNPQAFEESYTEFPYPKAGETRDYNTPIVNIYIHNTVERTRSKVGRPSYVPYDSIISYVNWLNDDQLFIIWLDREQVNSWFTVTSASQNKTWLIFKDGNPDHWSPFVIESVDHPYLMGEEGYVYLIMPKRDTPKQFRGAARIRIKMDDSLSELEWITWPDIDIDRIVYIYPRTKEMLFISSGPRTEENHLYHYDSRIHSPDRPECLSCGNSNCTFSSFEFDPESEHLVQNCLGPIPKGIDIIKFDRYRDEFGGERINQTLKYNINPKTDAISAGYAVPKRKFIELTLRKGTDQALNVTAEMLMPPELDETHVTKYPLLLFTYGGPTRRNVRSDFRLRPIEYIASTMKVVVLNVDGRGTYGRGLNFEKQIYKKLGVVEVQDQLDAVKAFVERNSFINRSHIAAYGWSYGGFTVGHLLSHSENYNLIKCGIAVAPVTDFRMYNTAYAERYLGRYKNNTDSYVQTSIISKVKEFGDNKLLLIHGIADDNVHFIQSAKLASALLGERVDFDYLFYPDENHGLRNAQPHLLRKKKEFLEKCFKTDP